MTHSPNNSRTTIAGANDSGNVDDNTPGHVQRPSDHAIARVSGIYSTHTPLSVQPSSFDPRHAMVPMPAPSTASDIAASQHIYPSQPQFGMTGYATFDGAQLGQQQQGVLAVAQRSDMQLPWPLDTSVATTMGTTFNVPPQLLRSQLHNINQQDGTRAMYPPPAISSHPLLDSVYGFGNVGAMPVLPSNTIVGHTHNMQHNNNNTLLTDALLHSIAAVEQPGASPHLLTSVSHVVPRIAATNNNNGFIMDSTFLVPGSVLSRSIALPIVTTTASTRNVARADGTIVDDSIAHRILYRSGVLPVDVTAPDSDVVVANGAILDSIVPRRLLPKIMSHPSDATILSRHQAYLREQIEYFETRSEDLATPTRGRNRRIVLGQVGIRCHHCANVPLRQRQIGSTYFPASIRGLYQAAQNMLTSHLQCGVCESTPDSVKNQFKCLLEASRTSSTIGRSYWATCAQELGLVDTPDGIFVLQQRELVALNDTTTAVRDTGAA